MRFASDEQRKAVMARLHGGSSSKRRSGASLRRKSKRRPGASLKKKPVIKSPGEQYIGKQIDVLNKTAKLEGELTEYGKKVSYGGMVWSRDDLRRCFSNLAKKKEQKSPRALPQYTINGKQYFRDDRLREYRAIDNPHDRIRFDELRDIEAKEGSEQIGPKKSVSEKPKKVTYSTWKYKDMDVTGIAKLIRKDLKKKYPSKKFSVKIERYSMGRSINVSIKKPGFMVRNPTFDPMGSIGEDNPLFTVHAKTLLDEVRGVVEKYNYDASDPITDYYDVGFASDVSFDYNLK